MDALPLIDLSRFTSGLPEERAEVAAEWDKTFRTTGFCLLTGYESILPQALIQSLRDKADDFFALPSEKKKACMVDGIVGYLGYGDENVAATLGKKTVGADLVESLNFPGYQQPEAPWRAEKAFAECPWRSAGWVKAVPQELQEVARKYWASVTELMRALMDLTEIALDLPHGYFKPSFAQPGTLLKLAYYPAAGKLLSVEGEGEPQQRYGAHTDYDGFTILQRDAADAAGGGGLEIQRDGCTAWLAAPAPKNTLTINIGDLLARWTNGRWKATLHRVARPQAGAASRLSIVYFTGPHPETLVEALPSEKCSRGEKLYPPITAKDHVAAKLKAAATQEEPPQKRQKVNELAGSKGI